MNRVLGGVLVVLWLLVATAAFLPWVAKGAGGLNFDGTTDVLDCGSMSVSVTEDYINIAIFMAPNFTNARVTDSVVVDNFDSPGQTGFQVEWEGSTQQWRIAAGNSVGPNRACRVVGSVFSAGDALGFYGSIANNVQNCEVFNLRTKVATTGSAFNSFGAANNANSVFIGADATGAARFFDGDVFMLVITNTRIKNTNNNQLASARELLFLYMWPGNPPTQTNAEVDYVAAYDFTRGNVGTALANPNVVLDRSPGGNDCTVVAGATPLAVGTPFLH